MSFYRAHRRFAAWLAMCVMVFGALAPTLAQAMVAASDNDQWVEICSASGMVWLKADGSDVTGAVAPAQGAPMGDMGKHCPWCGFHGAAAGLPPDASRAPAPVVAHHALPASVHSAQCSAVQRMAQARAPPLAS
jgi:hypothetical protein